MQQREVLPYSWQDFTSSRGGPVSSHVNQAAVPDSDSNSEHPPAPKAPRTANPTVTSVRRGRGKGRGRSRGRGHRPGTDIPAVGTPNLPSGRVIYRPLPVVEDEATDSSSDDSPSISDSSSSMAIAPYRLFNERAAIEQARQSQNPVYAAPSSSGSTPSLTKQNLQRHSRQLEQQQTTRPSEEAYDVYPGNTDPQPGSTSLPPVYAQPPSGPYQANLSDTESPDLLQKAL